MLLFTAAATLVMVFARVASDTDQETMLESLRAVDENRTMYGLSGIARLLSGLTLLGAGWLMLRTWTTGDRWATPMVPYLFVLSGAATGVSGAGAVLVAAHPLPEAVLAAGASGAAAPTAVEIGFDLRWIAGKAGFTAAGAALLVAAFYQWRVGGTLCKVAPVSAVLGVAMQLIWLDAASFMHPVIGTGFFLWLLVIGTMLATGRVQRHFVAAYGGSQP